MKSLCGLLLAACSVFGSKRYERSEVMKVSSTANNGTTTLQDGISILQWNIFDPLQGDSFPSWQIQNANDFEQHAELIEFYDASFCKFWLEKTVKTDNGNDKMDVCEIQSLQDLFVQRKGGDPDGIITQIYKYHVFQFKDYGRDETKEDDTDMQKIMYRSLFWEPDDKLEDALAQLGEKTQFNKEALDEIRAAVAAFKTDLSSVQAKKMFAMSFDTLLKVLFPAADLLEAFRRHVLAARDVASWAKRGPLLYEQIERMNAKDSLDVVILTEYSVDGLNYVFPLHDKLSQTWTGNVVPTENVDNTYFDVGIYWRADRFKPLTSGYWDLGERDALKGEQKDCKVKNTRAAYVLLEPTEPGHEFYGKAVLVVGVHLNTGSYDQDGRANRLANYELSKQISALMMVQHRAGAQNVDAVLVMGDMNTETFFDNAAAFSEEDDEDTILKQDSSSFFADAVPRTDADGEKMYTYAAKGKQRLDHALYFPHYLLDANFDTSIHQTWKKEAHWPSNELPSDHEPTVVRFRLKPGHRPAVAASTKKHC